MQCAKRRKTFVFWSSNWEEKEYWKWCLTYIFFVQIFEKFYVEFERVIFGHTICWIPKNPEIFQNSIFENIHEYDFSGIFSAINLFQSNHIDLFKALFHCYKNSHDETIRFLIFWMKFFCTTIHPNMVIKLEIPIWAKLVGYLNNAIETEQLNFNVQFQTKIIVCIAASMIKICSFHRVKIWFGIKKSWFLCYFYADFIRSKSNSWDNKCKKVLCT